MSIELSDDEVSTEALGANTRLFGARSSSATEVISIGREAIYNYIVATLATVASSGSATDLESGTLPLDRLHSHLQDIANINPPVTGDLLYYNGANWSALAAGAAGHVLTSGGAATTPSWSTTGAGDMRKVDNLSGLASTATARENLGVEIGVDVQAWDAQLDEWATVDPSENGKSLVSAADYAAMKSLLDLEIGTDLQAWSTHLDSIAALARADGNVIVGNGTTWVAESGATARTSLGLGTGDSPIFTNLDLTGYLDLTEIAAPATPSANHARMWAEDNNGFSVLHWKDSDSLDHELGRDLVHIVRNTTGSAIPMGSCVYISGSTGTVPNVALAQANSAATMPAYGITTSEIAHNSFGQIMTAGDIRGLNTAGFSAGDVLYVSATTPGALTTTAPTGTNIPLRVGVVITSNASQGVIGITIGADQNPATTQTLTNKTIALGSNTVSGTAAEFDTAVTDDNFLFASDVGSSVQAWDAQLDSLSSASANGVSLVTATDYAAMRTLLDLEVGTDFLSPAAIAAAYQPLDADLTALAGLTSAANKVPYFTGAGMASVADFTASGRAMVAAASATAQTALLDAFTGDSGAGGVKGLVPAPATGDAAAAKFLKADGTWTTPAGGGDVTSASSFGTDNVIVRSDGTGKGVQSTGITIDDSDNIAGVESLGLNDSNDTHHLLLKATSNLTADRDLSFATGDAARTLTFSGDATLGAGPTTQVFTSSGTWNKPTGLVSVDVVVIAGGGSSGAVANSGALEFTAASGGGGGGASRKRIAAASLGATETVTIGAGGTAPSAGANNGNSGGTSSFGTHCSATGGGGGFGVSASANGSVPGGTAGVGSSGDVNYQGGGGNPGFWSTAFGSAGNGGMGALGSGGAVTQSLGAGQDGLVPGGGGSGAYSYNGSGAAAGGAGGPGIVIVVEFYS